MGSGLLSATLTKVTIGARTPGSYTSGPSVSTTNHTCRGVISDYDERQIDGSLVQRGDRRVLLLGGSLPSSVVPAPNDEVTIEGTKYSIVNVRRDPAGASYTLQVRGV